MAEGLSDSAPKRPRNETIILAAITLFALGFATVAMILPSWEVFVPAVGISFFCGIALATLAFTFLGGKTSDKVEIRGIQLSGAVAVVVALILVTNDPFERQIGLLERLQEMTKKVSDAENKAKAAEEVSRRELIVERGSNMGIVSGGQVELDDVNTLNGWGEGPHTENKQRANAAIILARLFRRLDIQNPPAAVLAMDEAGWQNFLASLPAGKRLQLGGIPFARIKIYSSDGRPQERLVFKKDVIPVLNKKDDVEAFLCIRRILDVRERRSDEPEVIVLTHSRKRCE